MKSELEEYLTAVLNVKDDLEKLLDLLYRDHMWQTRASMHVNNRKQIEPFELGVQTLEDNLPFLQGAERILQTTIHDPYYSDESVLAAAKIIISQAGPLKTGIIEWLKWSHGYQGLEPFSENSGSASN